MSEDPGTDPAVDPAAEWRAAVDRVTELVRTAEQDDAGASERSVPACPDWTVRELLAHMIGLDADTLGGDEPDDHNAAWTQGHVDARADADVETLLAEWHGLADELESYIRERDPRPLGDAIIHEQDLRGALDSPGARDTPALALIRGSIADRLRGALDGQAPLRLESVDDGWTWTSATDAAADADAKAQPGAVLRASGFDLFRAVTSRRSADQLRGYVVDGDVEPYLEALAGLGPLPERELPE